MWNNQSLWFEVSIVSSIIALGHILLGHFEERTSRLRKLSKYAGFMFIVLTISALFGRIYALWFLVIGFMPVLYIHLILLPKNGINGWTGKPKAKYYEFRKWDKNIFK